MHVLRKDTVTKKTLNYETDLGGKLYMYPNII